MSTQFEEEKMIKKLSNSCIEKLKLNSHKNHWNTLSFSQLSDYLDKELYELNDAMFSKKSPKEVWSEIGDACNFLAMIGENYEKQYNDQNGDNNEN